MLSCLLAGFSLTCCTREQANPSIAEPWYQSWLAKPWHRNPTVVAEFQLNTGESKSFEVPSATKREIGFLVKDYTKADGDRLVYLQSPDGAKRVGGLPGTSATFTPVDGTISVVVENHNPTNTRVVLYHEDVEPAGTAPPASEPADKSSGKNSTTNLHGGGRPPLADGRPETIYRRSQRLAG